MAITRQCFKSKVLHVGYQNQHNEYKLYDKILEETDVEKDLGVLIDKNLKFHEHTAAATKKVNQILGIIKRSYTSRDLKTISTLYKAMVRPHLEYGNVIWGPFYQGDILRVESIQRRATKLVPELMEMPYEQRLRILNLPSLSYRRKSGDMILMYKIMNGLVRIDSKFLFTPATYKSTRGHSKKIFKKHSTKLIRSNCFSQRVIDNWNSLPDKVINSPSLNIFKNRLDITWHNKQFLIN